MALKLQEPENSKKASLQMPEFNNIDQFKAPQNFSIFGALKHKKGSISGPRKRQKSVSLKPRKGLP